MMGFALRFSFIGFTVGGTVYLHSLDDLELPGAFALQVILFRLANLPWLELRAGAGISGLASFMVCHGYRPRRLT
jgi:hypothetical protein